ncbi:DUF4260 domain-containing protein [Actinomycetospora lutea]|uniref:DUF4260 domain-containing protein n=1 Tax=Actinomycetospora lutea TaxID=663604 RepID=UPI0023664953|nr:DUF4260 domain-containing protein [Actinomycetospora lutea]MDD7942442.1 DUF4260 domain-containing protein [Actinomycetospora lutea]
MSPLTVQRLEKLVVVIVAVVVAVVRYPSWWWVVVASFLVFDLSMVGYVRSARAGAICYNAVHTYLWPGALAVVAISTAGHAPAVSTWTGITACAWAFHIGVDRMFGFGLKLPDGFTHTHLGRIGRGAGSEPTAPRL